MPPSAQDQQLSVRPLSFESEDHARSIVDSIFQSPSVASRVAHDHRKPGYIDHPAVSYLGAFIRGALVGLFMGIRVSPIEVDLHAALLPTATRHARDLGRLCLDFVFQADAALQRVTAYVIENLVSARNYCIKLGFTLEGMRRGACMQGGRLLGVVVLGMTRAEWEGSR